MAFAQEVDAAFVNYMYEQRFKPATTRAAAAMKSEAPFRQGGLRDATGAIILKESNANRAIFLLFSNPPQTASYNRAVKDFGSVDYANFTNARGSSKGWRERAYAKALQEFR